MLFLNVVRWVHVVCALYVPGVAFGDIDKLRPVTLTEMNYSKYGAKASMELILVYESMLNSSLYSYMKSINIISTCI